jgi:hypothetical protein
MKNPALDANGEFVFREFNQLRREEADRPGSGVQAHVKRLLVKHFTTGAKPRPAREDAEDFFDAFAESNEQLRQLAFPQRGEPLFDDDFSDYPEEAMSTHDAVDHELICRVLLAAWLEEVAAGEAARKGRGGRNGSREPGGVRQALIGLGRAVVRR